MKIYKNGVKQYEADKETEMDVRHIMRVWNNPNPSTEEIVTFFRLSAKYPNVTLNVVRE